MLAILAAVMLVGGAVAPGADERLVGITAVCLRFDGFSNRSSSVDKEDEEVRTVTGLTVTQWAGLRRSLKEDVAEILTKYRVPVVASLEGSCGCCVDALTPSLVFTVSTSPLIVTPPRIYFLVRAELMEPAELLRRPGTHGVVATWANARSGFSERESLTFDIKNAVTFWAKAFGESFARTNPLASKP
jgi:hypothetical protein